MNDSPFYSTQLVDGISIAKAHLKAPRETYSQFLKRYNYCFKNAYMQDSDCYLNNY